MTETNIHAGKQIVLVRVYSLASYYLVDVNVHIPRL